jgi:hypothetical protein
MPLLEIGVGIGAEILLFFFFERIDEFAFVDPIASAELVFDGVVVGQEPAFEAENQDVADGAEGAAEDEDKAHLAHHIGQ